jgi:hypothetical protein
MKHIARHLLAWVIIPSLIFVLLLLGLTNVVRAEVSQIYVYVCTGDGGDWPCTNPYGPISYEGNYIPQVLANEWPGQANIEALKAGAITIRTFGWRRPGCGAIWGYRSIGGTDYRIEHNISQRYWLPNGGQNTILSKHTAAVNATNEMVLRNHITSNYICAKYKADCGNPTAAGADEPWTLASVADPVDRDNGGYHLDGLSQNGSHAWELSGYMGAAPWDYRQILSHYYAQTAMRGLPFNRWVWLDADTTGGTRYTAISGEQYYGTRAYTPLSMRTGRSYVVPFHVQNTSAYSWNNVGVFPERFSYHWYDAQGNLVIWNGLRTELGLNEVSPAQDMTLQAKVVAPFTPGIYTLKWDMVSTGEVDYWFSTQSGEWKTQDVVVDVQSSSDITYLPYVLNRPGWVSVISIRNNQGYIVSVDVTYMTTDGYTDSIVTRQLLPFATVDVTPPAGFWGSAWVAAGADVTVTISPTPKQSYLPLTLANH